MATVVATGRRVTVPPAIVRPREDAAPAEAGGAEVVSFEDAFDAEVRQEFGDLGPAATTSGDGGGRGGERRGGDRGRRSGGRGR